MFLLHWPNLLYVAGTTYTNLHGYFPGLCNQVSKVLQNMHRVHPGASTGAWAMSIVSCQWDKEEWRKPRVIKPTASFRRLKYTCVHPNTTYTLHYKQDLCRLNCAGPIAPSGPHPHLMYVGIFTVSSQSPVELPSPLPPAKDPDLSIQWRNSTFLILLSCRHHQIRVCPSHDLPCSFVKPAIQQLLSFLSKVLCIQILLQSREHTLSELHGFYHLSISHFQYVSVALMEKYGSPPVVKIIPLISHRW